MFILARSTCHALHISADEALGRSLDLIISVHLRDAHWRGYRVAMASGTTRPAGRQTVVRTTQRSGEKLYVETTFAVVVGDETRVAIGSVAFARDVIGRMEEERRGACRPSA